MLSCIYIILFLFFLPLSCPTAGGRCLSWILPSYLDAANMAAQLVPWNSTVTVDKRVGERKLKWDLLLSLPFL